MSGIEYLSFDRINPSDFLPVLNEPTIRQHLIAHNHFNRVSVSEWMHSKMQLDTISGCRVRAILIDGSLAGWCGIQPDAKGFEIAIVISQRFWGCGVSIFKTLMLWAKELGHEQILFHLLDSRPEYKFLKRNAIKVENTALMGRRFTSYTLAVDAWYWHKS